MRKLGVLATLALVVALALPLFVVSETTAQDDMRSTFDLGPEPAEEGPLAGVDPSDVTITWWHQHGGAREEFLIPLVEEFNANNPWGIMVEASNQGGYGDIYNKMIAGIPTGDVPNIVVAYQNQSAAYYLAGGLTEDMDIYVTDETWGLNATEKADFIPGFFNQDYTPDGQHRIGFPPNRSIEGMYFNMTALEELGYDAPPTSWEQFGEMACMFTEQGWSGYDGDDPIGYTVRTDASNIAAGTYSLGGDIFMDGEFNYDGQPTIDYIQFMVDLYNDGCAELVAEPYGDQNNFTAGKALFYVGSTSGLPYVRSGIEEAFDAPFEWSVTYLPYEDVPVADIYGASVSIVKSTPEKELASWLFIRWFAETQNQANWAEVSNYFPVRFSTAQNMDAMFEDFPQYEAAWGMLQGEIKVEPQIASYDVIRDEAEATYQNLLVSGGDVESALTEFNITANEIMASFMPF